MQARVSLMFCLLLVPVLAQAQANEANADSASSRTAEVRGQATREAAPATTELRESRDHQSATTQNNPRQARYDQRGYRSDERQETVLVSEICTFNQANYTYSCK